MTDSIRWRCEDGHIITCEEQPRACTHTARGYVFRATDALVVPPTCGKPLRPYLAGTVHTPRPIGGQPLTRPVETVDCLVCGKPAKDKWYCDDCWSDKQGGYTDG